MLGIDAWLGGLPPLTIFLVVGAIILLESMGIPLPGEITLISASLLAATGAVNIWGVAIAASAGAIIGDSIGYAIGRRGGRPLLEKFGRRFPKHFGPGHLARAERTFAKWGVWAVFFGRFVALLRILAGPLAGALHVPYRKFLIANATGGILWATGTAFVIYFVGHAAEKYLKGFAWIALVAAVVIGLGTTIYLRRRAARADALLQDADPNTNPTPAAEIAAIAVHTASDAARTVAAGPKGRRGGTDQAKPTAAGKPQFQAKPLGDGEPRKAMPKPPADRDARAAGAKRGGGSHAKRKPGTRSAHRPPKPRHG
jgi:membrane protein DedA with SNARE-associated domain